MDGMNADFALRHGWRVLGQCRSNCRGAKICPAADTCQSSHQTPFQQLSKLFHARSYSLYTQKMVNFMKVWGVASEDVGSRDCCRQAPMDDDMDSSHSVGVK